MGKLCFHNKALSSNEIERIIVSIKELKPLQSLDLSQNDLGDLSCEQIMEAVHDSQANLTLKDISISCQGLFNEECQISSKGLSRIVSIRFNALLRLDVSSNDIRDANILFQNCSNFPSLECLFLGSNNIDEEGVKEINLPKPLLLLDLSHNDIGGKGVEHIVQYLTTNETSLCQLSLNGNRNLGRKAGVALGSLLTTNSSLIELDVRETDLGVEGEAELCTGWSKNVAITKDHLTDMFGKKWSKITSAVTSKVTSCFVIHDPPLSRAPLINVDLPDWAMRVLKKDKQNAEHEGAAKYYE